MVVHNRIKKLRKEKGLSQKEFAKAFNEFAKDDNDVKPISYATISRWENEENEPKMATWLALASFFDVPISYLMGTTNKKDNSGKTMDDILSRTYDKDILIYLALKDTITPFLPEDKCQKLAKSKISNDKIRDFSELINNLFITFIDGVAGKDKKAFDVYNRISKLALEYVADTYFNDN